MCMPLFGLAPWDIRWLAWVKPTLGDALKIVTFVTMKPTILALFRNFSKKELIRPSQTRFGYMYIVLENMLDERVYNGLRALMVSFEYRHKKVAHTSKREEVASIVLSVSFWRNPREIVNICALILTLLHLVDRAGPTMGLVYELTHRMIENITSMDDAHN
ncbi:hypothetical protein KP509_19G020500 [Ceratopteris richardii]|uniref:Uncharacterized protein n=1 Tax=Ceratopteris richardii TaxID=49495 RepID=A0A8T2SLM6_CERRI|nr:hypothetical protein KP509_19G020500 [Ceratopteris richardii]